MAERDEAKEWDEAQIEARLREWLKEKQAADDAEPFDAERWVLAFDAERWYAERLTSFRIERMSLKEQFALATLMGIIPAHQWEEG